MQRVVHFKNQYLVGWGFIFGSSGSDLLEKSSGRCSYCQRQFQCILNDANLPKVKSENQVTHQKLGMIK